MVTQRWIVAAALLAVSSYANDSNDNLKIVKPADPAVAEEAADELRDTLDVEEPLLHEDMKAKYNEHLHRKSLLRTGSHPGGMNLDLDVPVGKGANWASDFEKDVTDLVMGISASGATPGLTDAVVKIKYLINTEMLPKVTHAHAENQDQLTNISGLITGCGDARVNELSAAIPANTTRATESANHKACRKLEASDYADRKEKREDMQAKALTKADKCKIYLEKEKAFGEATQMVSIMTKGPGQTTMVYVEKITSAICGSSTKFDCKDCCTAGGACPEAPTTNNPQYKWLAGPDSGDGSAGSKSKLDDYSKAKMDCDDATTAYNEAQTKLKAADKAYAEQRSDCDIIQDKMDIAACKYAVDVKDACQKYHGCYDSDLTSYNTAKTTVTSEETDRKAEWKGLMRMMCILDAFTGAGGITADNITTCKNKNHTVAHLDITYPDIPDKVECADPTDYPVTGVYKANEFGENLPAMAQGKVDANKCGGFQEISTEPNLLAENPSCKCERLGIDGPYSPGPILACTNCQDVSRSTEPNSCPDGTKLFAPRTREDWHTFIHSLGGETPLAEPNWIIDVTRPEDGCINSDNCGEFVMNSGLGARDGLTPSQRWVTKDGSAWWLRSSILASAPAGDAGNIPTVVGLSGDYRANCYLDLNEGVLPNTADEVTYKDNACTYHSKSYYCQAAASDLKPKFGSPSSCSCEQVALAAGHTYSGGDGRLVHCQKCWDVSKSLQVNSCPNGWKIFAPKIQADWTAVLSSIGSQPGNPSWIADITRPQNGCGGCQEYAMNSGVSAQATWQTADHQPWWLKEAPGNSPNAEGDYQANCYMDFFRDSSDTLMVHFDAHQCQAHSRSYFCQTAETTTTTTTTQATCASWTCDATQDHVSKGSEVAVLVNPTEALCCGVSCKTYTCTTSGHVKRAGSEKHIASEQECCQATCQSFHDEGKCPQDSILKAGHETQTSPTAEVCCVEKDAPAPSPTGDGLR